MIYETGRVPLIEEFGTSVSADDFFAPLGRVVGRIVGRGELCGLDCDIAQFGIAEIFILVAVLAVAFVMGRRIKRFLGRKQ